jgi:hypothetical protein
MKCTKSLVLLAAGAVLIAGNTAFAATDTKTVTVGATVNATAKLTLGSATVSFPDADPDTTPIISAAALTVAAKVKTVAGGAVSLTVLASDDLKNAAGDVILASKVGWSVGGDGFVGGTMNKTTAQNLGSWSGSGNNSGTQTYTLTNDWAYPVGSYTMTVTYTLTTP